MRWLLKRWWLWAGAGFMLVAICAGYLLIPVGEGRISKATYNKIRLGWTPKQVGDLLGLMDGTQTTLVCGPPYMPSEIVGKCWLSWEDEDGNEIGVAFDSNGVINKNFTPTNLTFFEVKKRRIERRIRALWR